MKAQSNGALAVKTKVRAGVLVSSYNTGGTTGCCPRCSSDTVLHKTPNCMSTTLQCARQQGGPGEHNNNDRRSK
jgi:hypothetical protein